MILNKDKSIIPNKNITYFLNPDYIYVPCKKIKVKEKDYVYKNQVIADNKHSQVSGVVLGIRKCQVLDKLVNTVVIQNDYREYSEEDRTKLKVTIPNILKLLANDKELFSKFKSNKTFDNIVIYAYNDSPYVYNEAFLLKENIADILEFYNKLLNLYASRNNMLLLKNNEQFIIEDCLNIIGIYPEINLSLVKDIYLLENPYILNKYLKLKGNTLYLKVSELYYLANLFKGKISTTKLITISGDALSNNKVLRVKINTSLKDILDKYIDITNPSDYIINGLMNGIKLDNIDNFIVTNEVESINIMKKKDIKVNKCIKCGKCIKVCPFNVNPLTLDNKKNCTFCGLCTYICPCYINLVERMK